MKRVFCKRCKYIHLAGRTVGGNIFECHHLNNKKTEYSWYNSKTVHIISPCLINKNNDCGWYEKRGFFMKVGDLVSGRVG